MKTSRSDIALFSVVLLMLPVVWDATGVDVAAMHLFGNAGGFPLSHDWLWSVILHDRVKWPSAFLLVLLFAAVKWPVGPWRAISAPQRLAVALATFTAIVCVTLLKRYSLTSCPYELQEFGGKAHWVSHWALGVLDGGSGHCFPGGHASSALGFLAVSWPFLLHEKSEVRQFGRLWWCACLLSGLGLGFVQTLRGSHYPSHTLWTAMICWTVGSVVYVGIMRSLVSVRSP